jgi:Glyoxalase-like domain
MRALGVPVRGPMPSSRMRPDGQHAEWEYAFLGDGEPGATLPFIIADRTPRDLRVRPSASVAGTELTGVELVVLAVPDLVQAAGLFRRVYEWPAPTLHKDLVFGATLAHFAGTPVVLAEDLSAEDLTYGPSRYPPDAPPLDEQERWLARRLARFGPAPCAFLLGTLDMAVSEARLPLVAGGSWFGRKVAWLEPTHVLGMRLGVVTPA